MSPKPRRRALNAARKSAFGLRDEINNGINPLAADSLLSEIDEFVTQLKGLYNELLDVCKEEEVQALEDDLCADRSMLRQLRAAVISAKSSSCSPDPSPMPTHPPFRVSDYHIPKFGGKSSAWPAFAVVFHDTLAQAPHLTNTQKLLLLTDALVGEAKNTVRNLIPSLSNFEGVWLLLEKKYENKRDITYDVVMKLVNHPAVHTRQEIMALIDDTRDIIRTLEALGHKYVPLMDIFFVPILISKLDMDVMESWDQQTSDYTTVPPVEDLLSFLQNRCRTLELSASRVKPQVKSSRNSERPDNSSRPKPSASNRINNMKCPECALEHPLFKCPVLTRAAVSDRWKIIKKLQVCNNCLSKAHKTSDCQKDPCRRCQRKHHSLLHEDMKPEAPVVQVSNVAVDCSTAVLSTALVKIYGNGRTRTCRMLLDTGSTSNYLYRHIVNDLNCEQTLVNTIVSSVHNEQTITCSSVKLSLSALCDDKLFSCTFLDMPYTQTLPTTQLSVNKACFKGLKLADPTFDVPGPIEGILGGAVFSQMLKSSKIRTFGNLRAMDTALGWVLLGSASTENVLPSSSTATNCALNRFWETEELPAVPILTEEETQAETLYSSTTIRLESGRFQVHLPLRPKVNDLGEGRKLAISRLKALERRFEKDPEFKKKYVATIHDYFECGDLEEVSDSPFTTVYLPHHGVLTSKLRVVFDASARTSTGYSLNDVTLDCPRTQDNLFNILVRFRTHKFALTADIHQMYRQIKVHPPHRNLQCIVWRDDPSQPIKSYRLSTVTWGTKAAPFLATRTLVEVAKTAATSIVKKSIDKDFYVDDLLSGAQSVSELLHLRDELVSTLNAAGFTLHKWASNLDIVAETEEKQVNDHEDVDTKTLGIWWSRTGDLFHYRLGLPTSSPTVTKRSVLSETNKVFDPLGCLAPVLLKPKLLLQRLWLDKSVSWDSPLPEKTVKQWSQIKEDWLYIKNISFPRRIIADDPLQVTICGFSDASEAAYAGVVYLKVVNSNGVHVSLVAAKTKVAPLRTTSLPRLELCGALLLAKLMTTIVSSIEMPNVEMVAFSDSTVALGWIKGHPSKWKTYVANRVQEIQSLVPSSSWYHVSGTDNPADCASRGMFAEDLRNFKLWWDGPAILQLPLPSAAPCVVEPSLERRAEVALTSITKTTDPCIVYNNYSSVSSVIRIIAFCLRFVHNLRHRSQRRLGRLTVVELSNAELKLWQIVQSTELPDVYHQLKQGKQLSSCHKFACLAPFMENGVIRVGGRLQAAALPYSAKHQILLPTGDFTNKLLRGLHIQHLHAGAQNLTVILRQRFWLTNALNAIKKIVRLCPICIRLKGQSAQQMMSQLPAYRINPGRPFTTVGVDLAGPINLRTQLSRGTRHYKSWVVIFICMTTRAIHLELLTSLSADAFIATLHRLVSRRGLPREIHSDNGTNFKAAAKIIKTQQLQDHLRDRHIVWHFNPPSAPHFGGLWEAGVKSIKYHLRRVVGTTSLTYEEFYTVLTRIEACLNSRPLTALSSDPNDLEALTPAHFLIGSSLVALPQPDTMAVSPIKRWQYTQTIANHFWRRWTSEFLSRLQTRPKWTKPMPNLIPGQLVIVKCETSPPLQWRLARVLSTNAGPDGLVRTAEVRTQFGNLVRPVVKLVPLPLDFVRDDSTAEAPVDDEAEDQTESSPIPVRRSPRLCGTKN